MNLTEAINHLLNQDPGPLTVYTIMDRLKAMEDNDGVYETDHALNDIYATVNKPNNNLKITPNGLIKQISYSQEDVWERQLLTLSIVLSEMLKPHPTSQPINLKIPLFILYLRLSNLRYDLADKGIVLPDMPSAASLLESGQTKKRFIWSLGKLNSTPYFRRVLNQIVKSFELIPEENLLKVFEKIAQESYRDVLEDCPPEYFGPIFDYILFSLCPSGAAESPLFPPGPVTGLMARLISGRASGLIYDPEMTTGRCLTDLYHLAEKETKTDDLQLRGQFPSPMAAAVGFMSLLANGVYNVNQFRVKLPGEPPALAADTADLVLSNLPMSTHQFAYFHPDLDHLNLGHSTRLEIISLQKVLHILKEKGYACISVPEKLMYEEGADRRKMREYLTKSDFIETVISLPEGIFHQFPGSGASILILSKSKPESQKGKVLFIDGESDGIRVTNSLTVINEERILSVYHDFEGKKGESYLATLEEIVENDFNLEASRYVKVVGELLANFSEAGEHLITLREVITQTWCKPVEDEFPISYVGVKELADTEVDYLLNPERLPKLRFPEKGVVILEESAILAARVGSKIKPTYFEYSGQPIAVASHVFTLIPDPTKVLIEYLIFELGSNFVRQQFEGYSRGVANPTISLKDFLAIKVRIPTLEEQDRRISDRKEYLYEAKLREAELLKARLKIEEADYRLLSTFKHNMMQRLERISSGMKVMQHFLKYKDRSDPNFSLNEPVMEPFPGENPDDIEKVGSVMDRLKRNIDGLIDSLEQNIADIEAGQMPLHKTTVNLYAFFRDEIIPELGAGERYKIELADLPGPEQEEHFWVEIDKNRIREVVSNLIKNAEKHGFIYARDVSYTVRFEFFEKKIDGTGYVSLIYRNDGLPFTEGFGFEDFVQRGRTAGEGANEGIGGNFIQRIVQKHGGIFQQVPVEELAPDSPWNINFEILLPGKID
ncbi:MAG: N-6 DNA methylase [Bacteroidia bacterium]|nr:N-6 DNA methylase [Bacteroidia bacterium]